MLKHPPISGGCRSILIITYSRIFNRKPSFEYLHRMEERGEEEQIGKHPRRRACKTYGDISESGHKSQCHTAPCYHFKYTRKYG